MIAETLLCCAPEGIRTPNLLIRSKISPVRNRLPLLADLCDPGCLVRLYLPLSTPGVSKVLAA